MVIQPFFFSIARWVSQPFFPFILCMQQTPLGIELPPRYDRYALQLCYFLLQSMAGSSFSPPPWFQSTRFHLKQRSQPHPQPYCALPTCNRCLSGLTFAITRSSCVWATCTEGQAAGSLFPALVKPGHLQPGRLLHAVTRHMISQLDTRHPYSKKMVFFTCLAFFALIGNCEMMFTLLLHLIQKKVFSFFWLFV